MPKPAVKPIETFELHLPPAEPILPSVVTISGNTAAWVESPARAMHQRLVESFAAPEQDDAQLLPARIRLAILVGSVTVLWSAIGGIVLLLR